MKPSIYYPLAPFKTFGSFADNFFDRSLADFFGADYTVSSPSVNVIENGDHYRIEVAAPGLEKQDFEVSTENGFLSISAKHEQKKEEVKEGKFMRREFNYTSFKRSFELPESVNAEEIEAEYEKGILTVKLPKREKERVEEARYIEIK